MAMLHKRDEPTYYDLVDSSGVVRDTVSKSKVNKRMRELSKVFGKMEARLVEKKA